MRHRIYLDTHFIDYLWDHRDNIWNGDDYSLKVSAEADRSLQQEEYELLGNFPELCWFNDWRIIIGDWVLEELSRIPNVGRRQNLLGYAEQLQGLSLMGLDPEDDDEFSETTLEVPNRGQHPLQLGLPRFSPNDCHDRVPINFPLSAREAMKLLPASDRPLVEEAQELGCDVLLTTDRQLLNVGEKIEYWLRLRIRRLTEFVDEEAYSNLLHPTGTLQPWPDLRWYTGMIPESIH